MKSFFQADILPPELTQFKKEIWTWLLVGGGLWSIGKYLDTEVFPFLEHLRTFWLDEAIVFLTERFIWIVFALFGVLAAYRIWKNPHHKSKMVPAGFAVFTAAIVSFILKSFFAIPRPFEVDSSLVPLVQEISASFPSAHTAVTFALLVPCWRISKILGVTWGAFALLVGLARVYENVHYPSDIAGGIVLGGMIGSFFSHPEIQKGLGYLWKTSLEFRRQSFHFVFGFLCVFVHWKGLLRFRHIGLILLVGLVISFLSVKRKLPIVSDFLVLFDRPRDHKFPGRGAFYFLLGVLLSILLFPFKIAYASILILSVGDSLNHLLGDRATRGFRLPWNRRKNAVGVLVGILAGAFASQFFVPLGPALLASSLAILLETVPFRVGRIYIDDNIFVPLVAGGVLVLMG